MSENNELNLNENLDENTEGQMSIEGTDRVVYSGDQDRSIKSEMEDCYID